LNSGPKRVKDTNSLQIYALLIVFCN